MISINMVDRDTVLDLEGEVPELIVQNQRDKHAARFLAEANGFYHLYSEQDNFFLADRAARRVRAEQDWFEGLIGHAPSVGGFYEGVIRSTLKELLPSRLRLGQGFVYSTHQEQASKQLDFIVYTDLDVAPLYQRDDFVVVVPSAVHAVGECKKALSTSDLKSLINATMLTNLGDAYRSAHGVDA